MLFKTSLNMPGLDSMYFITLWNQAYHIIKLILTHAICLFLSCAQLSSANTPSLYFLYPLPFFALWLKKVICHEIQGNFCQVHK